MSAAADHSADDPTTPWRALLNEPGGALLRAVGDEAQPDTPALIARWRKQYPIEQVNAAIALVIARRKAADRFAHADRLIADPTGIEQASSTEVAMHKARRFSELGADRVHDLCCGIGGDAMAIALVAPCVAIDHDPMRCWMTRRNVAMVGGTLADSITADVTTLPLQGEVFHLDPSRRDTRGRIWRFEDYQPGPAFIEDLVQRCPTGAIKLSPGIDLDELPDGEIEIISHHGKLVQAVWWRGDLAGDQRRATLLMSAHRSQYSHPPSPSDQQPATHFGDDRQQPNNTIHPPATSPQPPATHSAMTHTLCGQPDFDLPFTEPHRYVLAIDPAVERAELIGVLIDETGAPTIHPQLGLLTADIPIDHPLVTPFELLAQMPWRMKKVKRWLDEHGAGIVDVKTRGGATDADTAAKQLRGKGDTHYVVFVLRFDKQVNALICRRVD